MLPFSRTAFKFFFEKWKKSGGNNAGKRAFFNEKIWNCKTQKIEKIEFFRAFSVHTQIFLWDNSLMLCCSPKNFAWCFDTFWVSKILFKKKFSRKKGYTTEIFEKKFLKKIEKSKYFADRPKSAKYFWGSNLYALGGYAA